MGAHKLKPSMTANVKRRNGDFEEERKLQDEKLDDLKKRYRDECGAILKCIKPRLVRRHHWTPYLEWDPALRGHITHSGSLRLEGSFGT